MSEGPLEGPGGWGRSYLWEHVQGSLSRDFWLLSAPGRAVWGVASATCHSLACLPALTCLRNGEMEMAPVFVLSAFDGFSVFRPPEPREWGPRCSFLPPGRLSPALASRRSASRAGSPAGPPGPVTNAASRFLPLPHHPTPSSPWQPGSSPCCSVTQSSPILCDPMDCSIPGFPALHHLPEFAQTHVHWISDAMQPTSSPVVPFSYPQSFPTSGSFLVSQLFTPGSQSIGASASVFPVNT